MLRSADQNEDELNTWAELANGLAKRPPTELVAKLADSFSQNAFIHYINRDLTERYCVVIDGGDVRVFNALTGTEETVNTPHGTGYLAGGPFRAVTVADYTFIVNASTVCAMDAAGADIVPDPATFRWINRDDAGLPLQYPVNVASGAYSGELASMEKLPEAAAEGTLYKITGSVETNFVSYYVVRRGAVWDETVAPGLANALNASTLPHALVREGDGTFTFAPFSWAPRRVGDVSTNPNPTFVNRTISDVFFYQNRLGLLVDENVVFSCAGDFGNYWRNTIIDYIGSDVIDAAVATTNVALLKYAIPFNDGIMAFADQTQFAIDNGEEGLTPESLSISPVTRYEINTSVRPVAIGTEVYFCGDQSGSTAVWEYTRIEQGDSLVAAEITAHVPGLIPANIKQLVSASNVKTLVALTGTEDAYVYQFYWNGNEKAVSAWRPWRFAYPAIAGEYIDGYLYLVTQRPDGMYLERASLEVGAKPTNQLYQVHLDTRVTLTGTYDPVGDHTTFTVPYAPLQDAFRLVRPKTNVSRPDSLVDPTSYVWTSATTLRVPGNEPSVTAGEAYEQRLTFSRQFPLDYQGRPVVTGRLQLRTFTVSYYQTAFFRTEVQPYGDALVPDVEEIVPAKLAEFTGKVVGANTLQLNRPAVHTGAYSFQVYGDAALARVSITNDTHCGATFVSAEWEGFYQNRSTP
jgi:hypothetical protein